MQSSGEIYTRVLRGACFIYRMHRWPMQRVTTKTGESRCTYTDVVIYGCNTWRHFVPFCISVVTLAASSALFCPPRCAPLVMPRSLRAPVDFPWLINPPLIKFPSSLRPPFPRKFPSQRGKFWKFSDPSDNLKCSPKLQSQLQATVLFKSKIKVRGWRKVTSDRGMEERAWHQSAIQSRNY